VSIWKNNKNGSYIIFTFMLQNFTEVLLQEFSGSGSSSLVVRVTKTQPDPNLKQTDSHPEQPELPDSNLKQPD
jgi:hypothetical protein